MFFSTAMSDTFMVASLNLRLRLLEDVHRGWRCQTPLQTMLKSRLPH